MGEENPDENIGRKYVERSFRNFQDYDSSIGGAQFEKK